ncbi:MAG: very short patch repair endonuclease [Candidatus Angelobacter sp. Gp1-AA117]|nr:MAG: very short patch repair endonuclease [Candidatus Angelobacter sp. Gp1-AA117]
MPDHMTPEQRSHAMRRVKLKDGPLELAIQRELRRLGLCFQCNYKRLQGSPDIVFVKKKVAIFIDGDFWHGWRLPSWEHKLSEFWKLKLHANRKRDQRNFRCLRAADWTVIRLWEHEIRSSKTRCIDRILRALKHEEKQGQSLHKSPTNFRGR